MILFGKSKKHDNSALRSGTVEKTPSRVIAVPRSDDIAIDKETVLSRLHDTDEIHIVSAEVPVRVSYKGSEYTVQTADVSLSVAPDDPALHNLSEEETQILLAAGAGLGIEMTFSENNMESFHLQIKLLAMMVPDMVALIDDNAYRVFSGKWVKMTAASKVPPSPDNMFCVHLVNEPQHSKSVWIHTHGLSRCGTIELEILGATLENYETFYTALDNMAQRLIGDGAFIDEMEPKLIGAASDNRDIVVTWQRSEWSLRDFPKNIIGSIKDRNDEHNLNMGVVYLYETEDDVMNGKITPIIKWEKYLSDNAIYYKSTEETQRMRALALERVDAMRTIYEHLPGEKTLLIKIGLTPDPELGFDEGQHEYIWFEVNELRDDGFTATLTQNAYYVKGMVEGVQQDFTYDDIVDWRIYTEENTFSPDNIYRIVDEWED